MNTENFDIKINSLLKKYIFSEDSSPQARDIAAKIQQAKIQQANSPTDKKNTEEEVKKLLNGKPKPTGSNSTQTGNLST